MFLAKQLNFALCLTSVKNSFFLAPRSNEEVFKAMQRHVTHLKAFIIILRQEAWQELRKFFFDPAVTCQETRSKTEGAVATLHCSSARLLASFHCSQGRVSVDLPAPFRCFPFFTLCCSMLYPFWCVWERERQKREKNKGLSAYKYSHQSHQSQHYWLSVCLLLSPIDLGCIMRVFSCHGSRKGGGTLTMLLLL